MLETEAYLRKPLPAKARMWDGTLADAHRVAAWVIENGGHATVQSTGGIPSLDVRTERGSTQPVIENIYVIVFDADRNWKLFHKESFEKFFEPAPQDGGTDA